MSYRSPLLGNHPSSSPSTSATNYSFACGVVGNWSSSDNRLFYAPIAMTLSRLRLKVGVAPGTGKSWVFTIMKNGSATALSVTISGAATSGSDLTNSVSLAAGDSFSIRSEPSGTPATPGIINWYLDQVANGFNVFAPATVNTSSSATRYLGLFAVGGGWNATETLRDAVMPCAGSFSLFRVDLNGSPGAGKNYTFKIRVNGAEPSGTPTVVVADSSTTGTDSSNSVAVAAGDLVAFECVPSGTPTTRIPTVNCLFTPSVDGDSFVPYGSSSNLITTTSVQYDYLTSLGAYTNSESSRQFLWDDLQMTRAYFYLDAAPGEGKSYRFRVRKNGSDTGLDVTIADSAQAGDATATVSPTAGDLLNYSTVAAGTPTATTLSAGILVHSAPIVASTWIPRAMFV